MNCWTRSIAGIAFIAMAATGCNMYEPIIKEMDDAYAARESDEDVSRVVQKHFPPGMSLDEALKLLHALKKQGFEIGEYRHEGARQWPDGDIKPYADEATRKNLQNLYPIGVSGYVATKTYDRKYFIVTKAASITVRVKDDRIVESSGLIWTSAI